MRSAEQSIFGAAASGAFMRGSPSTDAVVDGARRRADVGTANAAASGIILPQGAGSHLGAGLDR